MAEFTLQGKRQADNQTMQRQVRSRLQDYRQSSAPAQLNAHAYAQGRGTPPAQMQHLHGHTGVPAQLKKSKPDDATLVGLIGDVVGSSVGASAVGDANKADAVWTVLDKSYEDNKTKGTGLMTELSAKVAAYKDVGTKQSVIDANTPKDTTNAGKFNDNYSHTVTSIGGTNYRVNTAGYDPATTTKPAVDPGARKGAYSNEFDVASGKIKADWNFAELDNARKGNKGINNSEILWNQHKEAAKVHHALALDKDAQVSAAMKGISKIVRSTVINEDTQSTVYMAYPNGERWDTTDKSWAPGSDDFNAILGTPNARSTPFLLMDHVHELEKTIDKIETKNSSDMEIDFKAIP